ncbi:MAG: DnaJ domain-containing protein [Legionellaceae bacterium]|nr:DnaJ domain-containing protein [Legionellaceae bacterium]
MPRDTLAPTINIVAPPKDGLAHGGSEALRQERLQRQKGEVEKADVVEAQNKEVAERKKFENERVANVVAERAYEEKQKQEQVREQVREEARKEAQLEAQTEEDREAKGVRQERVIAAEEATKERIGDAQESAQQSVPESTPSPEERAEAERKEDEAERERDEERREKAAAKKDKAKIKQAKKEEAAQEEAGNLLQITNGPAGPPPLMITNGPEPASPLQITNGLESSPRLMIANEPASLNVPRGSIYGNQSSADATTEDSDTLQQEVEPDPVYFSDAMKGMRLEVLPEESSALNKAYRKESLARHPDKGGDTADFQTLKDSKNFLKTLYDDDGKLDQKKVKEAQALEQQARLQAQEANWAPKDQIPQQITVEGPKPEKASERFEREAKENAAQRKAQREERKKAASPGSEGSKISKDGNVFDYAVRVSQRLNAKLTQGLSNLASGAYARYQKSKEGKPAPGASANVQQQGQALGGKSQQQGANFQSAPGAQMSPEMQQAMTAMGLQNGLPQTEAAFKTHYKKQALARHPDKNPGNPNSAEAFKKLSEAKQFLDQQNLYGPDGQLKPSMQQFAQQTSQASVNSQQTTNRQQEQHATEERQQQEQRATQERQDRERQNAERREAEDAERVQQSNTTPLNDTPSPSTSTDSKVHTEGIYEGYSHEMTDIDEGPAFSQSEENPSDIHTEGIYEGYSHEMTDIDEGPALSQSNADASSQTADAPRDRAPKMSGLSDSPTPGGSSIGDSSEMADYARYQKEHAPKPTSKPGEQASHEQQSGPSGPSGP